jgi:type I restriction enzyme M protein
MLGAIIGDISGSRFQWDNIKRKNFELLNQECYPTDDSIMTLAVAKAILACNDDYTHLEKETVYYMQKFGRIYYDAEYGARFYDWIFTENPKPYNSFGNGAAMRVSPCGFAAKTLEEAVSLSRAVTKVTHNHPEGMKAAEAVSVAIFMARELKKMDGIKNHMKMSVIRKYIENKYYKINFTLDSIRPTYEFDVTCQGSVPQAFEAFFESTDFEDAIRNAISIGGDSDTIAAITGGMAEAYYGIPSSIRENVLAFLDNDLIDVVAKFERKYGG